MFYRRRVGATGIYRTLKEFLQASTGRFLQEFQIYRNYRKFSNFYRTYMKFYRNVLHVSTGTFYRQYYMTFYRNFYRHL